MAKLGSYIFGAVVLGLTGAAIYGILDARKVPYSSSDAERIVLATLPNLAARLQITA